MKTAADIMDPLPLLAAPDESVATLARTLLDRRLEGACVVVEGRLLGVVTTMDLVFREKNVHLPTFFTFMDAMIPLGFHQAEEELGKIAGMTVREIMSHTPVTVGPDTDLADMATLMVDGHLSMLPVVDGDRLVGVVDKRAILEAAFPRV